MDKHKENGISHFQNDMSECGGEVKIMEKETEL